MLGGLKVIRAIMLAKVYLATITEGNSAKDKIAMTIYPFDLILNLFRKKKVYKLPRNVSLRNKDGLFFCSNHVSYVLIASSFYEPKLRETILSNIEQGVFVDVGANIGKYTIAVGRKLKNKGKVIAFEPVPKNFRILLKNIELNNLENVIPIECALGSKEGKSYIYLSNEYNLGGYSLQWKGKAKEKLKVRVRKLDNVLKELKIDKVDLIKIDVEGFEAEVLKGAKETLKRSHPKIIFEAWDEEHLEKVKEVIKPFGYKIERIDSMNYFAY